MKTKTQFNKLTETLLWEKKADGAWSEGRVIQMNEAEQWLAILRRTEPEIEWAVGWNKPEEPKVKRPRAKRLSTPYVMVKCLGATPQVYTIDGTVHPATIEGRKYTVTIKEGSNKGTWQGSLRDGDGMFAEIKLTPKKNGLRSKRTR